jgi:hypothetical protein
MHRVFGRDFGNIRQALAKLEVAGAVDQAIGGASTDKIAMACHVMFSFLFNEHTKAQFAMTVKLSDKENAVETELVARVRALGGRAEKVTVLGRRGFFDRLLILPGGRVVFCEVKRPRGGRLSAHQIERARIYTALGAVCCVISNSADIDALLNEQGPRN